MFYLFLFGILRINYSVQLWYNTTWSTILWFSASSFDIKRDWSAAIMICGLSCDWCQLLIHLNLSYWNRRSYKIAFHGWQCNYHGHQHHHCLIGLIPFGISSFFLDGVNWNGEIMSLESKYWYWYDKVLKIERMHTGLVWWWELMRFKEGAVLHDMECYQVEKAIQKVGCKVLCFFDFIVIFQCPQYRITKIQMSKFINAQTSKCFSSVCCLQT